MANVLGGSGVFSGPTAAEYSQQNMQALAQAAQNANQFAQMRTQDLQNRRAAFLEMAKANGMSPALMLATPEGEAAAKSILGKNFFGMIGPQKEKWEAFFGMPMSQEDWNAFAGLEKAKGNLTFDMVPGQAPGASDRARAAQRPARTSVPLSAAPSAPAPVSTPAQPEQLVAPVPEQSGNPITVISDSSGKPIIVADTPSELATRSQAINRIAQGLGTPEELRRYFMGSTPADAKAKATAMVQRMREIGYDPYKAPATASGMQYAEAVDSTDQPSGRSITTSDYNPDGTLKFAAFEKPASTATPAPGVSLEDARSKLIAANPGNTRVIGALQRAKSLEDLKAIAPKGYEAYVASDNTGAGAVEAPRTVAGVTLSAAPTPKELGAVTRSVETASRDAVRTWKANPAVQDAGYQANLQMAARMLQSHEMPGARIEDNPMMAKAVLNFTEQAYRKVETDIRRADISNQLDTMQVMSQLAAQSAMGVIAQSQQAVEMLKPLQAQWDSLYKPQIEALAKAGKTPPEISKIMAEDPQYMAADKLMKTTIARAFGDGTAVTQTYIKDPVGFFNALFGGMAKTTPTGYAVDLSAGAGQRVAAPPDQLDAVADSIMAETK